MKKYKKKEPITELSLVKRVRRCWTRDPVEKIVSSKTIYNRRKNKKIDEESAAMPENS